MTRRLTDRFISNQYLHYIMIGIAMLLSFGRAGWLGSAHVNWITHNVTKAAFDTPGSASYNDIMPSVAETEQELRWSIFNAVLGQNYSQVDVDLHKYMTISSEEQKEQIVHWVTQQSYQAASQGDEDRSLSVLGLNEPWLDSIGYYVQLGDAYSLLGDLDRAATAYEQSLSLQKTPQAMIHLAEVHSLLAKQTVEQDYHAAQQHYEMASQYIQAAIALDASFQPEGDMLLGDIYWKMNRRVDSVYAYLRVTENPGNSERTFLAWYYLGSIYAAWWTDALDYQLARSYFERALAVAPNEQFRTMASSAIADIDAKLAGE